MSAQRPVISALYSRVYRLIAWLLLAGFPVGTLIAVQVSSLRYQSNTVIRTQQVCIGLDLIVLGWLFYRQRRRKEPSGTAPDLNWVQYWITLLASTGIILGVELFYVNVPGANENTVRSDGPRWTEVYRQPLDLGLCPALHWGCRYLTVDHRTLVGHVWSSQAIADLRAEPREDSKRAEPREDSKKSLAAVEGIFLRERVLRFANFNESALYNADMISAEISYATFDHAQLQGARLRGANLSGAHLEGANLSGANLLQANLSEAHLQSADLSRAILERAGLWGAHLSGANLFQANLSGAHLSGADLSGANLEGAHLSGAHLEGAQVTPDQLSRACGDSETKSPFHLTIPCPR